MTDVSKSTLATNFCLILDSNPASLGGDDMINPTRKGSPHSQIADTRPQHRSTSARRDSEQEAKIAALKAAQRDVHRNTTTHHGATRYTYERGPDGHTYVVDATTHIEHNVTATRSKYT